MAKRSQEELIVHPCYFKLKDFEKPGSLSQTQRVKKTIPKLDANGNPIYKEVEVRRKKSCGCKNKDGSLQEETVKHQIPETEEVMVDVSMSPDDNKMVICKLYGSVKRSHCEGCHTYKVKTP